MAREKEDTKGKKGGVSLDDEDAIDVGLFGPGPARITESLFTEYDYGGNIKGKPPVVWLVTFERGEGKATEKSEQPYGIGNGWSVNRDGELVGKNGQTGLPKTCNAMVHLVKPLKKALKKAGIDADFLASGDASALEGMEVELDRVEQEERSFRRDNDRGGRGGRDRDDRDDRKEPKTILEIVAVESVGGKKSSGSKKKAEDDDEDEAPKGRGARGASKDADDEDEKPARGKAGKGKADDDDADTDSTEEDAIEAMVSLVEKGPVDVDEMEAKLKKVLKGNKNLDAIIDLCMTPKFIKLEKGWSYNKKDNSIDAPDE